MWQSCVNIMLSEKFVLELVTLKIMKHFTVSFLVSGWFGFGGQTQQAEQTTKQKPKVEPATSLPIR